MIHGHKMAGNVTSFDPEGRKIERELRQCILCQATWIYQPGSGARRGFCLHHMGLLCGRKECMDACRNDSHVPFFDARMQDDRDYRFDSRSGLLLPASRLLSARRSTPTAT